MRILIVSDAWLPQINGVVRTLCAVRDALTARGHVVEVVAPGRFRTVPCPTYPEIRLALWPWPGVRRMIEAFAPDAIHIATEGPLGFAARSYCVRRGLPFTTAFHTKFPEYVHARGRIPVSWGYAFMRWFHRPSCGVMVATGSLRRALEARGFGNIRTWTRGVDVALFRPCPAPLLDAPRPIWMFVGRIAVEKNIEAFLALELPGTKFVVGDGPMLESLRRRHPEVRFTGAKLGEELAAHVASADVFVFPSLTDTFGLVLLEALACGVPVAAYPVTGPLDLIDGTGVGVLDHDLGRAARAALRIPATRCRAFAEGYSWDACARMFLDNLAPIPKAPHGRAATAQSRANRCRGDRSRPASRCGRPRRRRPSARPRWWRPAR